jgi:hypothetical protein
LRHVKVVFFELLIEDWLHFNKANNVAFINLLSVLNLLCIASQIKRIKKLNRRKLPIYIFSDFSFCWPRGRGNYTNTNKDFLLGQKISFYTIAAIKMLIFLTYMYSQLKNMIFQSQINTVFTPCKARITNKIYFRTETRGKSIGLQIMKMKVYSG